MKTRSFLLAAGVLLAMVFTLSCSSGESVEDDGSSSSTGGESSSSGNGNYLSCTEAENLMMDIDMDSIEDRCKKEVKNSNECDGNLECLQDKAYLCFMNDEKMKKLCGGNSLDVCGNHYETACKENLPKQVYLVDTWSEGRSQEEFSGNGDVIVYLDNYASYVCHGGSSDSDRYCECTSYDGVVISPCKEEDWYDTLLVGKIQNGQISFLPTSIDNKYLDELEPDIGNNEYCQGIYSSDVPKNIFAESFYLYAIIPEKSHCRIRPYLIKSGKANRAAFFYFSEAGKITGTRTCAYPDEEIEQINYDMDFSKGWNLAYTRDGYFTTDLSKGGILEWWLQCEDD